VKKALFFILLPLLFPLGAHALTLDCAKNPEATSCVCYLDTGDGAPGAEDITEDGGQEDNVSCQQYCDDQVSTAYEFYACEVDGKVTSSGKTSLSNTVTLPADSTDASKVAKKNPLIPNLNVAIPGLDFSNSVNSHQENALIAYFTDTETITTNLLGVYVAALFRYALGAAAIIAVIMLMIGGLQYATARGDSKAVSQAKERITNAIIGLVLLFLAFDIAFFLDPKTVLFSSLSIKNIQGIELESDEIESESLQAEVRDAVPLSGNLTTISGTHLTNYTSETSNRIDKAVLEALNTAADEFYGKTLKNIQVTSASRSLQGQTTLFYQNCLATGGVCSPSTCDPTQSRYKSSSVLSYTKSSGYSLTGDLAGEKNKATIIETIANEGVASYCPHTSNVAVDIWPQGSGKFQADVKDMQDLITTMTTNGFCRLSSEAWHFELDSVKVDKQSCQKSYNTTNIKGHSTRGCLRYNFKHFCCVAEDPESTETIEKKCSS
jgi:hypothetical protein